MQINDDLFVLIESYEKKKKNIIYNSFRINGVRLLINVKLRERKCQSDDLYYENL